jgi:hypothetical protein
MSLRNVSELLQDCKASNSILHSHRWQNPHIQVHRNSHLHACEMTAYYSRMYACPHWDKGEHITGMVSHCMGFDSPPCQWWLSFQVNRTCPTAVAMRALSLSLVTPKATHMTYKKHERFATYGPAAEADALNFLVLLRLQSWQPAYSGTAVQRRAMWVVLKRVVHLI